MYERLSFVHLELNESFRVRESFLFSREISRVYYLPHSYRIKSESKQIDVFLQISNLFISHKSHSIKFQCKSNGLTWFCCRFRMMYHAVKNRNAKVPPPIRMYWNTSKIFKIMINRFLIICCSSSFNSTPWRFINRHRERSEDMASPSIMIDASMVLPLRPKGLAVNMFSDSVWCRFDWSSSETYSFEFVSLRAQDIQNAILSQSISENRKINRLFSFETKNMKNCSVGLSLTGSMSANMVCLFASGWIPLTVWYSAAAPNMCGNVMTTGPPNTQFRIRFVLFLFENEMRDIESAPLDFY